MQDNNTTAQAPHNSTWVALPGEGFEYYNANSGYTHWNSKVTLVEVSHDPARWEQRHADGSVGVYTFADRAATLPNRKVFLTQLIDPQGQARPDGGVATLRLP